MAKFLAGQIKQLAKAVATEDVPAPQRRTPSRKRPGRKAKTTARKAKSTTARKAKRSPAKKRR